MKNLDKVICLHCIEDTERYKRIYNELNKVKLMDISTISEFPKLDINVEIGNQLTKLHTPFYNNKKKNKTNIYGNVFSCMYNWLILISHAYKKGYNSVLCIEDDVYFNTTSEEFTQYLEEIPTDANIILFGYVFKIKKELTKEEEEIYNGKYIFNKYRDKYKFIKMSDKYKTSGMFGVWLNRKGMEYYIKYITKNMCCSDIIFTDIDNDLSKEMNINIYVCNKEIIKHDWKFSSLITQPIKQT